MTEDKNNILAGFFSREYRRMVSFVAERIDDAADRDGEDLVQDVMTGILARADISVPFENLSAYIYQSLKNRIIDTFRNRKKTISINETADTAENFTLMDFLHDTRYDAASALERDEMRRDLYSAIDTLNREERALIIMTEFEGMSYKDISEIQGIPIGTLLSKKSRALIKVRKLLKQNYLKE
jgi:RNA polymerase sigma-70 factor (ECF subfamily)